MKYEEWEACNDPEQMLAWLGDRLSVRKALLFACGCCRELHWRFGDTRSWAAIEAAEQFADGVITAEATRLAATEASASWSDAIHLRWTERRQTNAGENTAMAADSLLSAFRKGNLSEEAIRRGTEHAAVIVRMGVKKKKPVQAALLRDVAGNPFRPVAIEPAWLTRDVIGLAQASYDDRHLPDGTLDGTRLAILADALEDAGCTDVGILSHLRGPGPHVRGCHAVDALLGRA
jgi:hypothetical protein